MSPLIDLFIVVTFYTFTFDLLLALSPFWYNPSLTPTFKAFHYQWGPFTPMGSPPVGDFAGGLRRLCEDLSRAVERLKLVSAHDALVLLKNSLSAPKLLHTCLLYTSDAADE